MFAEGVAETTQIDPRSGRLYDIVVPGIFFGTTLARGVSRECAEEYVREWNYAEAAESILPRRLFIRLARPPAGAPTRGFRGIAARLRPAWRARRFAVPSIAAVRRSLIPSPLLRAAALRAMWAVPPHDRRSFHRTSPAGEEGYDIAGRCLP
jgi:hypothetical protein